MTSITHSYTGPLGALPLPRLSNLILTVKLTDAYALSFWLERLEKLKVSYLLTKALGRYNLYTIGGTL